MQLSFLQFFCPVNCSLLDFPGLSAPFAQLWASIRFPFPVPPCGNSQGFKWDHLKTYIIYFLYLRDHSPVSWYQGSWKQFFYVFVRLFCCSDYFGWVWKPSLASFLISFLGWFTIVLNLTYPKEKSTIYKNFFFFPSQYVIPSTINCSNLKPRSHFWFLLHDQHPVLQQVIDYTSTVYFQSLHFSSSLLCHPSWGSVIFHWDFCNSLLTDLRISSFASSSTPP